MVRDGEVLVTGSNSGFGKHCLEYFKGVPFHRQTKFEDVLARAKTHPYRAIIHAAYQSKPLSDASQFSAYLQDTLFLTQKLLQIPHDTFIFISTTDVYPKNGGQHHEDDVINVAELRELYPISKLMSESLVREQANRPLIIRPTAMLGRYAKPNSLIKMMTQENPVITLAAESSFNYILHQDVSHFIERAMQEKLSGIYNVCSTSNMTLSEIAHHFKRQVQFGQYHYQTDNINNHKAASLLDCFKRTSLDNIQLYLQE